MAGSGHAEMNIGQTALWQMRTRASFHAAEITWIQVLFARLNHGRMEPSSLRLFGPSSGRSMEFSGASMGARVSRLRRGIHAQ